MPASSDALVALGRVLPEGYTNSRLGGVGEHVLLWPLTDLFAMPAWLPAANIFSVGDLLIGIGAAVAVGAASGRTRFDSQIGRNFGGSSYPVNASAANSKYCFSLLFTPAGSSVLPDGIYALSMVCTHLGCTVRWFQTDVMFRCPCHGSTYTKDGGVKVFGPAPRPLDVFPITVNPDKSLTVLTGRTYEFSGNSHNPARTIPNTPGSKTPPKII